MHLTVLDGRILAQLNPVDSTHLDQIVVGIPEADSTEILSRLVRLERMGKVVAYRVDWQWRLAPKG